MSDRFEWELKDTNRVEIKINGRNLKDSEGKFIDTFVQKTFEIDPKELLTFKRVFDTIAHEYCRKFKCRLDSPECH